MGQRVWTIHVPPLRCRTLPLKCSTLASKESPQINKGFVHQVRPLKRKAPEYPKEHTPRKQPCHASRVRVAPTKGSVALAPDQPRGLAPVTPPRQKVPAASWKFARKTPRKVVNEASERLISEPSSNQGMPWSLAQVVKRAFTPRSNVRAVPSWLGVRRARGLALRLHRVRRLLRRGVRS